MWDWPWAVVRAVEFRWPSGWPARAGLGRRMPPGGAARVAPDAGLVAASPCGTGWRGSSWCRRAGRRTSQADQHRQGKREADPAGELVDVVQAGAGDTAEQDMGNGQDDGGRPRPEGEGPVAQAEHAGQAGEDDPNTGGAAADGQGPAAAPQEQALDPVQAGRADPRPRPELSNWRPQRRPIQ